jgi:peptide/nickel transport system permease protein
MRIVDFAMAIPVLFLILIIQVQLSPSIWNVMIVIGATSWMGVTRLVRAEVLSIKERPFVLAAKARGIAPKKLMLSHILPLSITPIIVSAMLGIGGAILTESVLSFLGMGVQPPHASWGNMLKGSLEFMTDAPWLAIIPGCFITITVLALNFIGDGLRLYFNPKERYVRS